MALHLHDGQAIALDCLRTAQTVSLYFDQLCRAMALVAEHPRSVFVGQATRFAGTAMHTTLRDVPMEKRIEFPVAEDMQAGFCTGAALAGDLPVCMFPRFNFLLLATNQIVLHLDKLPIFSDYRPRVIIRTAVATAEPLDPGPQHLGDFSDVFRGMLKTVRVVDLNDAESIVPEYRAAMAFEGSTLLVERMALYG